jgi:hypothetical protein
MNNIFIYYMTHCLERHLQPQFLDQILDKTPTIYICTEMSPPPAQFETNPEEIQLDFREI